MVCHLGQRLLVDVLEPRTDQRHDSFDAFQVLLEGGKFVLNYTLSAIRSLVEIGTRAVVDDCDVLRGTGENLVVARFLGVGRRHRRLEGVVGHDHPQASRPLTLVEIEAMRSIVVPADAEVRTEIPADAATGHAVEWSPPMETGRTPASPIRS